MRIFNLFPSTPRDLTCIPVVIRLPTPSPHPKYAHNRPFSKQSTHPKNARCVLLARINAPFPSEADGLKMRGCVLCGRIIAPDARRVGAQSGS